MASDEQVRAEGGGEEEEVVEEGIRGEVVEEEGREGEEEGAREEEGGKEGEKEGGREKGEEEEGEEEEEEEEDEQRKVKELVRGKKGKGGRKRKEEEGGRKGKSKKGKKEEEEEEGVESDVYSVPIHYLKEDDDEICTCGKRPFLSDFKGQASIEELMFSQGCKTINTALEKLDAEKEGGRNGVDSAEGGDGEWGVIKASSAIIPPACVEDGPGGVDTLCCNVCLEAYGSGSGGGGSATTAGPWVQVCGHHSCHSCLKAQSRQVIEKLEAEDEDRRQRGLRPRFRKEIDRMDPPFRCALCRRDNQLSKCIKLHIETFDVCIGSAKARIRDLIERIKCGALQSAQQLINSWAEEIKDAHVAKFPCLPKAVVSRVGVRSARRELVTHLKLRDEHARIKALKKAIAKAVADLSLIIAGLHKEELASAARDKRAGERRNVATRPSSEAESRQTAGLGYECSTFGLRVPPLPRRWHEATVKERNLRQRAARLGIAIPIASQDHYHSFWDMEEVEKEVIRQEHEEALKLVAEAEEEVEEQIRQHRESGMGLSSWGKLRHPTYRERRVIKGGYSLTLPGGAIPVSLVQEAFEYFEERRATARGQVPRTAAQLRAAADSDGFASEEGWVNRPGPNSRPVEEFARECDHMAIEIIYQGRQGKSWTRQRDGNWVTNHTIREEEESVEQQESSSVAAGAESEEGFVDA